MDLAPRREINRNLLEGRVHGPSTSGEATARALERAADARTVVLVEGVSDQMAVEAVADRNQIDLAADRVVVLPIGGAHALSRFARRFGPLGDGMRLLGLCDAGEETVFLRGLAEARVGTSRSRVEMEQLGFFVCVEDLEDELIRAVHEERVVEIIESQGDLRPFRSLQTQPAWRDQELPAQLHRFFGSGARRKLRYARLLAESVELDRLPYPLQGLLARL
ncbi:ATP-dependent endonuclease [Micromonospora sp. NPDC047467]|uniref:ATP-dependent endonuclease n=1 Tax=Micromonospora sp. NPDC047467 TaxID=3154814 RepID=UPI0033C6F0A3